jgi:hypothetical protein
MLNQEKRSDEEFLREIERVLRDLDSVLGLDYGREFADSRRRLRKLEKSKESFR